jgi:hypothetical protein
MMFSRLAKTAVALAVAAALSLPAVGAASADSYPPQPDPTGPVVTKPPNDGKGKTTIRFRGEHLEGKTVAAKRGNVTIYAVLKVVVVNGQTYYQAQVDLRSLVRGLAGSYHVRYILGDQSYLESFKIGKAVKLKNVKAKKTASGATVRGKALKNSKVKIQVKRGSKVVANKRVKANSKGIFSYKVKAKKKGTYTYTVNFVRDKNYYGASEIKGKFKKK